MGLAEIGEQVYKGGVVELPDDGADESRHGV